VIRHQHAQQIAGWTAVGLSAVIACFWAFWGIIENFHEGWWHASLARNLGMLFGMYLAPMLLFVCLALAAVRWPYVGSALHLVLVVLLAVFVFGVRHSTPVFFIFLPLILVAGLYAWGRPQPQRRAYAILIGLPLLTLLVCGIEPAWRVAGRVDDGDRGARLVEGNGVRLIWAPAGPGWPDDDVDWKEARRRCRFLSADGRTLAAAPQEIWRLPTVEEAVRSMARHGQNCAGVWDPGKVKPSYRIMPDKESPLWDGHSETIYWWTATEVDEDRAYIIVYNGGVWPRKKSLRMGTLGFRAVMRPATNAP
jgi:hypothetical protein